MVPAMRAATEHYNHNYNNKRTKRREQKKKKRVQKGKKGPEVGMPALYLSHDGIVSKAFLGDWQVRSF